MRPFQLDAAWVSELILYPAIDIRGGAAVRLIQGDYERETAYDADPLDAAERWVEQGAEWLHVVDLDGARSGEAKNLGHVRRIADRTSARIQLGGGLRDDDAVGRALDAGAERVVIGTAALRDPAFCDRMLAEHGEAAVIGVDAKGGMAAAQGWTETSDRPARDLIHELSGRGARHVVWTPIEVDGTMEGPPLDDLRDLVQGLEVDLIYSGGVGSLDHLRSLARAGLAAVGGVVVGRALYEGQFTVAEALKTLEGR